MTSSHKPFILNIPKNPLPLLELDPGIEKPQPQSHSLVAASASTCWQFLNQASRKQLELAGTDLDAGQD